MTTEFNLSEKIEGQMKTIGKSIPLEDVKEFIRLLKEDTGCHPINSREKQIIKLFKERINKLAGSKLIL